MPRDLLQEVAPTTSQPRDLLAEIVEKPKKGISKVAEDITNYMFPQALTEAKFGRGEQNIYGDIFNRPAAAIRSGLMGRGYIKGATVPEEVPTFGQLTEKNFPIIKGISPLETQKRAFLRLGAEGADIFTNPANLLMMLTGGKIAEKGAEELGKAKQLVGGIAQKVWSSPVAQPIKQFGQVITRPSATQLTEEVGQLKSTLQSEQENLKTSLNNIATNIKAKKASLENELKTNKEMTVNEVKNRFGQFARDNSKAYGKKLQEISKKITPTQKDINAIFDKSEVEIQQAFIDEGVPLKKFNAIKAKYSMGVNPETQPEMAQIAKKLQYGKTTIKNAGIDWNKVVMEQSGRGVKPTTTTPFEQLVKDINQVSKEMTAGAKGALRQYTDEDIVAAILQKNFGEYVAEKVPEFANLQKEYSPIIEHMKAVRKIFKPGAYYETSPKALNIVGGETTGREAELMQRLKQGTPGFAQGMGEITQPVATVQGKIAGTEKAGEIATQRLTQASQTKQADLISALLKRQQELAKAKTSMLPLPPFVKYLGRTALRRVLLRGL